MSYEYFYGSQSESFSFYRIPRQLVKGQQYRSLSVEAKLLYGLLLDRMGLSLQNGWFDEQGRVYIYYTLDEIAEDMCCGHTKACRLLAELDEGKGIGLIERKKQGQGKPAKIYVKQFVEAPKETTPPRPPKSRNQDFPKTEVWTDGYGKSGLPKSESADFPKADGNYNNKIQTDFSYTDLSIPRQADDGLMDRVKEQIEYSFLAERYPYDDPDSILELICEVLSSQAKTIRIGGEAMPTPKVQERFRKLTIDHVSYVLDSFRETTAKIINIRAYLLTALYNAPLTMGPYYSAAVRHDFS